MQRRGQQAAEEEAFWKDQMGCCVHHGAAVVGSQKRKKNWLCCLEGKIFPSAPADPNRQLRASGLAPGVAFRTLE